MAKREKSYDEYVLHPRYGRGPLYTGLNPREGFLKWNVHLRYRGQKIPNTAIAADVSRQKPATIPVTHYLDEDMVCVDCNRRFIFFAAEQKYWYEGLKFGLDSDCIRCVECRKIRQGKAREIRRYRELHVKNDRNDAEHMEMAECAVSMMKEGKWAQPLADRVRWLLKQMREDGDAAIARRQETVLRELEALESFGALGGRERRQSKFAEDGYSVIPGVVSEHECELLAARISDAAVGGAGNRNLLSLDWCRMLGWELRRHRKVAELVSKDHVVVQCTYFEKSAERNWLVPTHQDLSIPVAERVEDERLTGWSMKEGVWHVRPPVEVLEKLVAVRVHLDDCGQEDGTLRVVPGSHRFGMIDAARAGEMRREMGEEVCAVERGGVLLMKPLLLHALSKGTGTSRRRVLHYLFGPPGLPYGLRWVVSV